MKRPVIGYVETVTLVNNGVRGDYKAKIDTGATKSSIDSKLAVRFRLGPVIETKLVKNVHGNSVRPIVHANVILAGIPCRAAFTIADRSKMRFKILIGQNILNKGYVIDPLVIKG